MPLHPAQALARARRAVAALDAIAGHWLGHTLPPVREALGAAEWEPDARNTYCPRCGSSVGAGEVGPDGCGSCRGRPVSLDGFVRLGRYEGELREWILQIKYHGRWVEMAEALGARLGAAVAASGAIEPQRAIVVPMPMPWQRRLYRGIDHARIIGWGAARALGVPQVAILAKRQGVPQVALGASQRARSGARDLRVRPRLGGWRLRGVDVILVDDVRTTGASLRAATRVLRRLRPARIVAAVLAVADEPGRST